jgi:hypothetical protein
MTARPREVDWAKRSRLLPSLALLVLSCFSSLASNAQNNAPPDKPVATTDEQRQKLESAIAPYVKKARQTLPGAKKKYLAGLPPGQIFYVTVRLYDPSGTSEQVFVKVTSWKLDSIQGMIASDLTLLHNHAKGEKITCRESAILDWTISKPDGTEEGNFVGKFLDTYQP